MNSGFTSVWTASQCHEASRKDTGVQMRGIAHTRRNWSVQMERSTCGWQRTIQQCEDSFWMCSSRTTHGEPNKQTRRLAWFEGVWIQPAAGTLGEFRMRLGWNRWRNDPVGAWIVSAGGCGASLYFLDAPTLGTLRCTGWIKERFVVILTLSYETAEKTIKKKDEGSPWKTKKKKKKKHSYCLEFNSLNTGRLG